MVVLLVLRQGLDGSGNDGLLYVLRRDRRVVDEPALGRPLSLDLLRFGTLELVQHRRHDARLEDEVGQDEDSHEDQEHLDLCTRLRRHLDVRSTLHALPNILGLSGQLHLVATCLLEALEDSIRVASADRGPELGIENEELVFLGHGQHLLEASVDFRTHRSIGQLEIDTNEFVLSVPTRRAQCAPGRPQGPLERPGGQLTLELAVVSKRTGHHLHQALAFHSGAALANVQLVAHPASIVRVSMSRRLGKFTLHSVLAGTLALDGGVMFGVVPKELWSTEVEPDEHNRVTVASRCLLIQNSERTVLVDAGPGTRWTSTEGERYRLDPKVDILGALDGMGIDASSITDVIISHLHWDQSGGLVRDQDGTPSLTFPRAVHHVQRRNWKWAHTPSAHDRRTFRHSDLDALERSGRLHFVEGETEILDGILLVPSEGHTVGQQLVRVQDEGETILYCGDTIPTAAHVRIAWGMGYDLYPLTVIEEKKQILAEALEENWLLFLARDSRFAACSVREDMGRAVVDETFEF